MWGGSRQNSISLLEAIDLIEKITGKKMDYKFGPKREADHIWWITDISKAKNHFPNGGIKKNLNEIFYEIYEALASRYE